MTQAITQSKLTFEEYRELPYDGRQIELVNGELVELTPARQKHHRLQRTLYDALRDYAKQVDLGWEPYPTGPGVQISANNSYIPDLVIATTAQWEALEAQDTAAVFPLGNPPLLVVEIVSPSSKKKDTEEKRMAYATAKVPEYWIINARKPKTDVSVWVLAGDTYTLKGKFKGEQRVESELVKDWSVTAAGILG